MNLGFLRKQHQEIGVALQELEQMLAPKEQVTDNAHRIALKVAELAGKLKMHLNSEDQFLYPSLLNSTSPQLRETAQAFSEEMGGLAGSFANYKTRYMQSREIKADPETFIASTRAIIGAIVNRVEAEENKLYCLLDG